MEASIFIGDYAAPNGRLGEPSAEGLGTALRRLGFEVGRLKTGTPARVLRSSLDLQLIEEQRGEDVMLPFSFTGTSVSRPSLSCFITYTNTETHDIIRSNIDRSPLYGGKIKGVGPRYCPSIEDKVMRFPDRERHQVFVEPEGLETDEMYLNGLSSSLPEEVQRAFLKTVKGLGDVVVLRPGYAVEYDYLNPTQMTPALETKRVKGLFVAGQTNGTSGYEEVAAQGLMAGINASHQLQKKPPFILSRAESYIGVLLDDLVTRGTEEPYRLFTSRAEYRLSLRHDTADIRLTEKGFEVGLQNEETRRRLAAKRSALEDLDTLLQTRKIKNEDLAALPVLSRHVGKSFRAALKDPNIHFPDLVELDTDLKQTGDDRLHQQLEIDVKYEGYIKRQKNQVRRFNRMESVTLGSRFDYDTVIGLSTEARDKLKRILPLSLGQASRMSGIRQSDLALLMLYTSKRRPGL